MSDWQLARMMTRLNEATIKEIISSLWIFSKKNNGN